MLSPRLIGLLLSAPAILVAITIHEFAHAWMADTLGDPTPRLRGRLSLNPIVHLDILGTLLLLVAGFGWAKPVEVNPHYFKDGRRGMTIVAVAGPLANVTLAFLAGLLIKTQLISGGTLLEAFVIALIQINLVLAVFNLIPIHPLDGSKILYGLLPPSQAMAYNRLAPYGPLVLLALILLPGNVLGSILGPPIWWLRDQALGYGSL